MKFYQVFSKKEYRHNGEDKTRWFKIGEIKVTDNGGKYLKLFFLPNTDFIVLPEQNDTSDDLLVID
ncbi:MAG: hypothetical protein R8P61_28205 [Bacteroidia bacterium]|nr:hypothetical protein [Bacteroidia bacterium]